MDLHSRQVYDAPTDTVFAMLTDPAFLTAKFTSLGHSDPEVLECGEDNGVFRIRTRRNVPLDVPGFAKKILGSTNLVTQTDEWSAPNGDGTRTGTWVVESKAPVKLSGTMELRADGNGTVQEIKGTATCGVPLVGGKVANLVGNETTKTMAGEEAFGQSWLAGGGR